MTAQLTRRQLLERAALGTAALALPGAFAGRALGAGPVKPKFPASIGKSEGLLTMVAWEGYTQPEWVKPFEKRTGTKVRVKFAGSSDEMVALFRQGGGGQFDLVSASGDASLRLIFGGDVQPINTALIPEWKQFHKAFQGPPNNTVDGLHYGVSLQWGPNILLYRTDAFSKPPSTWEIIYDKKFKGKITVPDNPIQIADAALFLMSHEPKLGIKDPYQLDENQFKAATKLLEEQRPLVKKYWALASDEIELFKNGDVTVGPGWPFQLSQLKAAKAPVRDTIPKEGATGWLDTWMLSSKSRHVNAAYLWYRWISSARVQAMQAVSYGETPVNRLACTQMNKLAKGSCSQYHADAPLAFYKQIAFWKTPVADCGDGRQCIEYTRWQQAWTDIKG